MLKYHESDGISFLSISALGRIREAFDLLVKDGKIEWKGSLRETYDAYFHPDVLDLDSEGMYDMLEQGQIFDAFQMSSLVARNAMRKIKPRTFNELAVTNTIIRLQGGHGESPIDKFVRYKNDISEWYRDMERYGLTKHEQSLMERHLLERTGIADTQEIIMNIIIDEDIANGGLEYANVFRKSIGKKDDKAIEKAEQEFKEIMKRNGHREEFANYITEEQFSLSYSYSFSLPHVVGYTLILLIEMNIGYHYGVSYWQTACLNASIFSGDEIKNKDYTSVAQFVNEIGDVVEPDINNSQMKFVTKEDKTLFALTGIIGLTEKTLNTIIEHRPFNSLEDFVERMVTTKLISEKQAVIMVKAGMFDNLEDKTKRDVMVDLVTLVVPKRDNVTMVQLSDVLDVVPKQFNKMIEMWDFRKLIKGREKVPMNKDIEREFIEKYADKVQYTFENGELVIDLKDFDKVYNKEITPLKEELKKPQYAERLTQIKRREFWKENCLGTPEEWEIETILYNPNNFVLVNELIQDRYEISDFKELQDNPVKNVTSWGFNEYHLSALSGVVVGAEHPKRVVYLLTENSGVVPLKLTRKQYPYYTEKLDGDDSWANRGTKLIALGYKNGESFMVRGDKIYRNPLIKLEVQDGRYTFRNKKLEN